MAGTDLLIYVIAVILVAWFSIWAIRQRPKVPQSFKDAALWVIIIVAVVLLLVAIL